MRSQSNSRAREASRSVSIFERTASMADMSGLQLRLDVVEFRNGGSDVHARCLQRAVGDLVARFVVPHDWGEDAAAAGRPIRDERGAILKGEARQSRIVGIVDVPSSSRLPAWMGPTRVNGSAAAFVDLALELPPAEHEIGLVIENLLARDAI